MFKLDKIANRIYHLSFDDHLDLCTHFLRWQEIYESPNDDFRSKPFELMHFIKWYSSNKNKNKPSGEKYSGTFSYFEDWNGFNIPLNIIFNNYNKLKDTNSYDEFMKSIADFIFKDSGTKDCYLIGSRTNQVSTMKHEIAHGLYFTNENYNKRCKDIIQTISEELYNDLCSKLKSMGYTDSVMNDEIQAFLSTGYRLLANTKEYSKLKKQFKNNFDLFYKKL